jgi:hypothetical protein
MSDTLSHADAAGDRHRRNWIFRDLTPVKSGSEAHKQQSCLRAAAGTLRSKLHVRFMRTRTP